MCYNNSQIYVTGHLPIRGGSGLGLCRRSVMSINISQLVIDLGWAVLILGALIWALREIGSAVGRIGRLCHYVVVEVAQKRRNKELIRRAQQVGCVLVYNTEAGITAVTPTSNLHHWIALERGDATGKTVGKDPKDHRALVAPVRVMPPMTFTFADEEEGYSMVTGTTRDKNDLLRALVYKVTGYRMYHVSREAWKYAEGVLIRKDRRLLVPMVREGHLPNGSVMLGLDAQCEMFGKLTLEVAVRELLTSVPR